MARINTATADRIRSELEELTGPGRDQAQQALEAARGAGKMEDSTDYWIADEARNQLETRIAMLQDLLAAAEVTDESVGDTSQVAEGCIVDVRFAGDDDVERYYVGLRIGAPDGVDAVTLDSPLGQAMQGAGVGETVTYRVPNGATFNVQIAHIDAA